MGGGLQVRGEQRVRARNSIFVRLLAGSLAIVLLGLGLVGTLLALYTKNYIYDNTKQELLRKAKKVNTSLQNIQSFDLPEKDREDAEDLLLFLAEAFDSIIWVFDRNGKIVATSAQDEVFIGKSVAESIVTRVLNGENVVNQLHFEGLDEPVLSVVVPWGKKDQIYGGIVLHAPVQGINQIIGDIREFILWITFLGLIVSMILVSSLSWTVTRPLRAIEKVASEIGLGNYRKRVEVDSQDEIGDLAKTINQLAERLEQNEQMRLQEDGLRQEFLANLSHELRTPLTGIQGFLEALQDGLVQEEEAKQRYVGLMYNETLHMSRLIEDLTDLMKIDKHTLSLYLTPVQLKDFLQKIAISFQHAIDEKGLVLHLDLPDEQLVIEADADRLGQIIGNLLNNAIKFTEQGSITIRAAKDGEGVLIDVKDTGIGMSEQDAARIWERFFKADRVRSKRDYGSGLGLSIVEKLVQMHHGRISVDTQLGEGSTFHIWLPEKQPSDHQLLKA
jgi:signal transduction histidine kinase